MVPNKQYEVGWIPVAEQSNSLIRSEVEEDAPVRDSVSPTIFAISFQLKTSRLLYTFAYEKQT